MLGRGERLRPSAAVAAVAIAACVAAGAALAAGPRERATALTGSSQWTSGYAIAGTFDGGLGRGTYSGTMTAAGPTFTSSTCGPVCAPLAGSITFSGRVGTLTASVQPGSVVSMEDIASHSFRDFRVQLRVVGGTGRYAHARGRLSLTYSSVWTHEWVNGVFDDGIADAGTLTGTLTGTLR
jgi:hypothetical protein